MKIDIEPRPWTPKDWSECFTHWNLAGKIIMRDEMETITKVDRPTNKFGDFVKHLLKSIQNHYEGQLIRYGEIFEHHARKQSTIRLRRNRRRQPFGNSK